MTQPISVIARLRAIAEPVIQSYKTDLDHDERNLADTGPADVWLWTPRQCGTHLILVERDGAPNTRAKGHFDAILSLKPNLDWYMIEGRHAHMIHEREAADLVAKAAARIQPGVRTVTELYM